MKIKKTLLLVFYLLAAVIVGGIITNACREIPFLSWLSYGGSIGISPENPFILDLEVVRLSFGFMFQVSVAQLITISLAIFAYSRTRI